MAWADPQTFTLADSTRSAFFCKLLRDFARPGYEQLRQRAKGAVLQGDDPDWHLA